MTTGATTAPIPIAVRVHLYESRAPRTGHVVTEFLIQVDGVVRDKFVIATEWPLQRTQIDHQLARYSITLDGPVEVVSDLHVTYRGTQSREVAE